MPLVRREVFATTKASGCHKAAVEAVVTLPIMAGDIGELLSSAHAKEKASNRKNLMTVDQSLLEVEADRSCYPSHHHLHELPVLALP